MIKKGLWSKPIRRGLTSCCEGRGKLKNVSGRDLDASVSFPLVLDVHECNERQMHEAILRFKSHRSVVKKASVSTTFPCHLVESTSVMKRSSRPLREQAVHCKHMCFHNIYKNVHLTPARNKAPLAFIAFTRSDRGRFRVCWLGRNHRR